jgi:hypothetical protein
MRLYQCMAVSDLGNLTGAAGSPDFTQIKWGQYTLFSKALRDE